MASKIIACTVFTFLCLTHGNLYAAVTFDWATVGNPGNAADQLDTFNNPNNLLFGAVDYTYRISKHEVTNAQYTDFLNAVAETDIHGLYSPGMGNNPVGGITQSCAATCTYSAKPNRGDMPVNFISFFDAMRFTNWLENGQPTGAQGLGTTEDGVYSIVNPGSGSTETRAAGAKFFIPSEDEWYKAAYHDPNAPGDYWDYPTQSNTAPTASNANMVDVVGDTTDVGAYPGSTSFYGTFDQAGNVWEWNEDVLFTTNRGLRGGAWFNSNVVSAARWRQFSTTGASGATGGARESGFRVASVPEPNSVLLLGIGVVAILSSRTRSYRPTTS